MFSVYTIKNNTSILLSFIFLATYGGQCYGMEEIIGGLGNKNNPIHFTYTEPSKESSPYWEAGKILAPIIAGAAINYIIQQYNKDPEMEALNKKEKEIELKIKTHPDYPTIYLQQEKNKTEEITNQNKEKQLNIDIATGQLIEHHKNEYIRFLRCDKKEGFTQDFCKSMLDIHNQQLERITGKTASQ